MSHKTIDRSIKTVSVASIHVNPYFESKSAEHVVTLTSTVPLVQTLQMICNMT